MLDPHGRARLFQELVDLPARRAGHVAVELEIGLAPLDEEDVLGVAHRKPSKKAPTDSDKTGSTSDLVTSSGPMNVVVSSSGSSKTRSLIEEELHDPELEHIQRKVAQRAQFNPLQPPGYVPPSSTPGWVVWAAIGGAALVLLIILLLAMSGGVAAAGEASSEHCHHEDGHSHGQAGHGSLHCLLASGVANLQVQSSIVDAPHNRRTIALVPPAGADVPRSATLDRDPPIPRPVS